MKHFVFSMFFLAISLVFSLPGEARTSNCNEIFANWYHAVTMEAFHCEEVNTLQEGAHCGMWRANRKYWWEKAEADGCWDMDWEN